METTHLSLTGRRWRTRSGEECDTLPHPTDAGAILSALVAARGIPTAEGLAEPLPPPQVYPDMNRAVERVRRAIETGERIGVFGDYDCDGVTATALLVRCLRRRGVQPWVRLPHRSRDGYGLRPAIAEECIVAGVTLLITVDTGITAVETVALLAERGIDVIVTDHHHVEEELPAAFAIVHPALAPHHPLPHPSGAGVALQLVRGIEQAGSWNGLAEDLALAAIGTVADLVELRGGNRTLVIKGLQALKHLPQGPLATFIQRTGVSADIRSTDIAFRIAPRINAAGRLDDPMLALTALLEGGEAAGQLDALNVQRQKRTEDLLQHALEHVDTTSPFLCIADELFHPGIVGLIAGKLTEQFGRPSLVASIEDGVCTASLRSPPGYHIAEGIALCSDLLLTHGGHAQAAGCSFDHAHFATLLERLSAHVRATVDLASLEPLISIDAVLDPALIRLNLCTDIDRLEPFGQGNPEPLFLLRGVCLERVRGVGAEGAHLQAHIGGIKAIGFRLGHTLPQVDQPLDLVCRIGVDTWQGVRAPQVYIEDIRISRSQEVIAG